MKVTDASQIRALDLNKQGDAKAAQKPETLEAQDRVTTDESARLSAAVAAATRVAGSASRAEMLQSIEAAVRQGTYSPDPNRIAARILDTAELAARLQAMLMR
jgi:negative regulator of flagellin synthesis FlgM